MPKQWAKIFRDVVNSDRLSALLAKNGFAEALYWRLKAMSDDFGRHPGAAADVGAAVCPGSLIYQHFKLKKVEQALQDMEACGLIRFYEVDGRSYLEIVDYLSHAHDKWTNVGRPEHPAPPGWTPPADLVQWLLEHAKAQNVSPDRFGVGIHNWPASIEYPFNTYSEGIQYSSNRLDETRRDVDETTADKTEDKKNDSAPSGAGLEDPFAEVTPAVNPPKPLKPPKPAGQDTPQQAVIRRSWEATGGTGAPSGKGYSGLIKLVQKHGIPKVEAWAAFVGVQYLSPPEGADRWEWFCEMFRRAMTRDFEWQRDGTGSRASPTRIGNAPMTRADAIAEAKRLGQA